MLLYHPAFDIYHCVFRMLKLLNQLPDTPIEVERFRILDFYLLFPEMLGGFTFPRELLALKKSVVPKSTAYNSLSDPKRIFFRLEPFQTCALKCLSSRGFIDEILFSQGVVKSTKAQLPEGLVKCLSDSNTNLSPLFSFLTGPFMKIDLYGDSGLKGRSDLFEYRYDLDNATTRT
jgi:hypothetical protein